MADIGLKLNKNSTGFSLIEVLIATAMLGGLVLGINIFISQNYESIRFLRIEGIVKSYHANLNQILGLETVCASTMALVNPVLVGDVLPKVVNGSTEIISGFPVSNIYTTENPVSVKEISVLSVNFAVPDVNFNLKVTYEFKGTSGPATLARMVILRGKADVSGNISTCNGKTLINSGKAFVKLTEADTKFGNLKIEKNLSLANTSSKIIVNPNAVVTSAPVDGLFAPSDIRLKNNIAILNPADFDTQSFGGYYFKYKGDTETQIGYLAQDLVPYVPQAVGESNGKLGIKYSTLIPLLWEKHKETRRINQQLQQRFLAIKDSITSYCTKNRCN